MHAIIVALAAGLAAPGCVVVTFSQPLGYRYFEFEVEQSVPALAEALKAALEKRGGHEVEIQIPKSKEEDPRFLRAYVHYAIDHQGTTYHHSIWVNCASTCWFSGAEDCEDLRCAISAGANEQTLGAAHVDKLLGELEQELGVSADFRGPPRREIEQED